MPFSNWITTCSPCFAGLSRGLVARLLFAVVVAGNATSAARAQDFEQAHGSTTDAVEQAHAELQRRFIDRFGIVQDFVGDLPTPEDCRLGRPNVIGWWSPIENGPMFTGLYLPAACERARRTGAAADRDQARLLAEGLMKCASVSDVPGFIARGVGTDGTCHYPLGSDDQTHPWFLGLHAYVKSSIPTADERAAIVKKMSEVAAVLESTGWRCPCDGAFRGEFRGGYRGHLFRDAVRYLYLLRAMHDVTGDAVWLERYRNAVTERPHGGDKTPNEKTRGEICAAGYPQDREAIKFLDESQLWIYVGSQASLAKLIALETDEALRSRYRAGLKVNVEQARKGIAGYKTFDNRDTKVFGNADWRAVYSHWFPQPTQADAARLAEIADKAKRGERKHYETRWMRNPLAACAITAYDADAATRAEIETALRHYDYAKLNMAEFFLAECAYYTLHP